MFMCVRVCVCILRSYVWFKPHERAIADSSYNNPEGSVRGMEMTEAAIRKRLAG